MVTFFFNSITNNPNPTSNAPFVFEVNVTSFGAKTLRLTFTLLSNNHKFLVNGNQQQRFTVTRPVPNGTSTLAPPIPAQIIKL